MAPPRDETVCSNVELCLGQTHRSHVSIVLDWALQFYHGHIIVVIAIRVIFWMFYDFVDSHVLLVSLNSIKIIFTCRGVEKKNVFSQSDPFAEKTIFSNIVFWISTLRFLECELVDYADTTSVWSETCIDQTPLGHSLVSGIRSKRVK